MRPVTMPSNATAPLAQLAEQLTLNQQVRGENPEEYGHSQVGAASGAAINLAETSCGPDLQSIVDVWPELPESTKTDIMAMIAGEGPS